MIKGIIIISSSGIPLFYKSYGAAIENDNLQEYNIVSNFLVANEVFSRKMIGKKMFRIQMHENLDFFFEKDEKDSLLFVLITDGKDNLFDIRQKLLHVRYAFISNFPDYYKLINDPEKKFHILPEKEKIVEIIDPIILSIKPQGDIKQLFSIFGVENIAKIFSSMVSKKQILVKGNNQDLIKKIVLSLPSLVSYREFIISNEICPLREIGTLIPYSEKIDIIKSNNSWFIIGTDSSFNLENKDFTIIDIENNNVMNAVDPSEYEYKLILKISKIKDSKLMYENLAYNMRDLLNIALNLNEIGYQYLSKEILIAKKIDPKMLMIIKKILKQDLASEVEIKDTHFHLRISKIFG